MKRILSVLLILHSIGLSTQAQDAKKAKELLDEVTAKVKSYNNIVIDFKYSLSNPKEKINQESNGNVAIDGNFYNLNFMGVTKIFDGKKVSLSPSIGNWSFECKAHYFIKQNKIRHARRWKDWEIEEGRKEDSENKEKFFKKKKKIN